MMKNMKMNNKVAAMGLAVLLITSSVFGLSGCGDKKADSIPANNKDYGLAAGKESPEIQSNDSKSNKEVIMGRDEVAEQVETGDSEVYEESENIMAKAQGSYVNDERYLEIKQNQEKNTSDESMLTFSLKVDTASYRNVVRYLNDYMIPPSDAVRMEEMINYFKYEEKPEYTSSPFSIYSELGDSPFDSSKKLAFIRVKAKEIDKKELPNSNLTFLIDTSGSMDSHDKLPLLKSAFALLTENLTENDRVSIVTYAGSSDIVLEGVPGNRTDLIISAIFNLEASGSTAGADGIRTAYELAANNFIDGGNNRVILATDGDFNVGISSIDELERFISEKRDTGVYLSILGFGTGNLRDDVMETLSKNGNGNYGYIDSVNTAKKLLVDELSSNLFTIADDVKAQVEFNPEVVESYRLIGYENRALNNEDFKNDKKDAGEIGVGTDVALMFEIVLKNNSDYKYKSETAKSDTQYGDELFEVRLRYKNPGDDKAQQIDYPVTFDRFFEKNSDDFMFASSVAGLGHYLTYSQYLGDFSLDKIIARAEAAKGEDTDGSRAEFIDIAKKALNIGLY